MGGINEALMFLINIALDNKDREWFMKLTSPEFMDSVPQAFVDEIGKLQSRYAKAVKENNQSEMIQLLGMMDAINEKYKFPKQYERKMKELQYMLRGKSFMKHIESYGIGNMKVILPDEAKKLWKKGQSIHVFLCDERSLVTVVAYQFLPDHRRREAESSMNWENICLLTEGDDKNDSYTR